MGRVCPLKGVELNNCSVEKGLKKGRLGNLGQ